MSSEKKLKNKKKKIEKELVCPLKDAATNMVFGKGNPDADIFFIGEAPGKKEDEQGLPFVGMAGKNLDKQLHRISLSLEEVYVANILKYRPPENRDPTKEEIITHTPYLIKQINIVKPKYIVTLGNYATKFVLSGFSPIGMSKIDGIANLHGKVTVLEVKKNKYSVFPMFHPSAIAYRNVVRKAFEEDFVTLGKLLGKKIKKKVQKKLDSFN